MHRPEPPRTAQGLRQEVEYLGGLGDETMTRLYDEFNNVTSEDERIRIAREFDAHYSSGSGSTWT